MLRFQCPNNITMQVFLQDGLHALGLERRMKGRHELAYECGAVDDIPGLLDSDLSKLKDWVFGLRCFLLAHCQLIDRLGPQASLVEGHLEQGTHWHRLFEERECSNYVGD